MEKNRVDALIRKLSLDVARVSSRRDFLSRGAQGLVGLGLGLGAIFGGGKPTFASGCQEMPGEPCGGHCCTPTQLNCGRDGTGGEEEDVPMRPTCGCDSGPCANCPTGWDQRWTYICCCNGRKSRCTECSKMDHPQPGATSFCMYTEIGAAC